TAGLANYHHSGSDDPAAQGIALLDNADHLAVFAFAEGNRLMVGRVEAVAIGLDLFDSGRFEDGLELSINEADAVDPGEAGEVRIHVLQCPLEVVDQGQDIDNNGRTGESR